MTFTKSKFTERVLSRYDDRSTLRASRESAFAKSQTVLPPSLRHLELGQQVMHPVANVFIDLRDFTSRSFWDDPEDVANLADAVLSGVALIVEEMGGWVVGLRGDGLFAVFGIDPFISREFTIVIAAAACARALAEVHDNLNPWLEARAIERVQIRAGADYGDVVFIRSGTEQSSEVNPVGFAANFASKCEKFALSWEVVVGQEMASNLGTAVTLREGSPKKYSRGSDTRRYNYYDFKWQRLLHAQTGLAQDVRTVLDDVASYYGTV